MGLFHPAYALHHALAGAEEPLDTAALATLAPDPSRIEPSEEGNLELFFFADRESAERRSAVAAAGGSMVTDTGYSLVVSAAAPAAGDLLRVGGVRAIEPYAAAVLGNQRASAIMGANQVRNVGNVDFLVNLDGTGEIAGVIDNGLDGGAGRPLHRDLAGRVIFLGHVNGAPGPGNITADGNPVPHGTHVTGSIAGNGTRSGGAIRGVAPACRIVFHALSTPPPPLGGGLAGGNFLNGLMAAHARGAPVHSTSWASPGVANSYTNRARTVDRFAFLNPESLVLFLAHNFEQDSDDDGILDMNRLFRESVAKNILCVGATENQTMTDGDNRTYQAILPGRYGNTFNALGGVNPSVLWAISDNPGQLALFSQRGRAANPGLPARRRIRPDVVAPGTNVISTGPVNLPPASAVMPFPAGN